MQECNGGKEAVFENDIQPTRTGLVQRDRGCPKIAGHVMGAHVHLQAGGACQVGGRDVGPQQAIRLGWRGFPCFEHIPILVDGHAHAGYPGVILRPDADRMPDAASPTVGVDVQDLWLAEPVGHCQVVGGGIGPLCQLYIQRLGLGALGIAGGLFEGVLLRELGFAKLPVLVEHGFVGDDGLSGTGLADHELVPHGAGEPPDKYVVMYTCHSTIPCLLYLSSSMLMLMCCIASSFVTS